jgi:cytochrome c oxidase subunit I+III
MLIAIPTGVKIFNWLATMWGGSLRFKPPLLFCCGMIAFFTVGGISGVTQAVVPFDWQVEDTYYIVAHLHNVLFAGTLFAVFAGFYYWFPKFSGRLLNERLGKAHFWLILVGFALTFFPMYLLGMDGMPRRVYTYAPNLGWNTLNLISSIGGFTIGLSILVWLGNVIYSLRRGKPAGDDPWDAWTLEWATTSPPPPENFATPLPVVHSERPLWDVKHAAFTEARIPEDVPLRREPSPATAAAPAHAAAPMAQAATALPFFVALAVAVIAAGLVAPTTAVVAVGALLTLLVLFLWAMEQWEPPEMPLHPDERFAPVPQGMLIFLFSEVALFGSLIYAYIDVRYRLVAWPPPGMPHLGVILPSINTDILIASGITMEIAIMRFRRGGMHLFRLFLGITIVLGVIFLSGQAWEYTHVGFGLSGGIMASSFFVLTGLHGAHVTAGLLLLTLLLYRSTRGRGKEGQAREGEGPSLGQLQAATYYWHFVDAVWVVLFIIIYLL